MRNDFKIVKRNQLYGADRLVNKYLKAIEGLTYYTSLDGIAETQNGIPCIFGLNGDAKHLTPNDNEVAQLFFYEHDARRYTDRYAEIDLSIVVWFNQSRLELGSTRIREKIIHELLNILRTPTLTEVRYFDTFQVFTDRSQIFTDFDIDATDILKYPFDGFRVRFTTNYNNEC